MVLICTERITNRIRYIFGLIFRDILRSEYELTTDRERFTGFQGVKFSYGKARIEDELFFASTSLLFERRIVHIDHSFVDHSGVPAFFPVYSKDSALTFDPFAVSFYMVTRYEEYLPFKKDEYGRFSAKESLAFNKNFLGKPVVNIWALEIARIISQHYPSFQFRKPEYRFIPTIDIDAAWSYKNKGFFRTAGGFLNSIIRGHGSEVLERARVLAGLREDPFDTYDFQLKIHRKYNLKPIYFILFAEYGLNDKNIPFRNLKFQSHIKMLADYAAIGIHPSYNSNFVPQKLKLEVQRLSKVLNREILKSRQHFLMVRLPTTYRNLINLDIVEDYSMGFAAQPGFRAGICSPFFFFDLELDVETKLKVFPFTYMEGTLRDYMKLSAAEALEVVKPLIHEVKAVGGTFISIWHNESLSNTKRWEGWQQLYEDIILLATGDLAH
jgi:hypothetical protein